MKVCRLAECPCHCVFESFYTEILFLNSRVFVYMMFTMQLFSWFHVSFWICVAVAIYWHKERSNKNFLMHVFSYKWLKNNVKIQIFCMTV